MDNHSQSPAPIDIFPLLKRLTRWTIRLLPVVVALALFMGIKSYRQAKSYFRPMYQSKAVFNVTSNYSSDDFFSSSYYSDTAAAQQLASVFPKILSTDFMRELIVAQLDKGYMNGSVSASSVKNTSMLTLTVTSSNPQDAHDILCAVIECYPQVAVYMIENPQVDIIQSPYVPTDPINSFSGRSSFVSGAIRGIFIGILLIAAAALLTQTVTDDKELKKLMNVPLLASFPLIRIKKRRSKANHYITAAADPRLSESLRGLRVKIHRMMTDSNSKVLLVTSTIAGEGKTTVASNLALSLCEAGHKVVLVDADFRHQTVSEVFESKPDRKGLMECLNRVDLPVAKCLKSAPNSTLKYISGTSTDERQYTISAKRMREVLETLKDEFDFIIIDSPPCGVVSDTMQLCRFADHVLYVVKQDYAHKSRILDAVTALHARDIRISGCVLNGVRMAHRGYGYGYGYSYGYGYGYGSKYGYGSSYGRRTPDKDK